MPIPTHTMLRMWLLGVNINPAILDDPQLKQLIEEQDGHAAFDRVKELAPSHFLKAHTDGPSLSSLYQPAYVLEFVGIVTGNDAMLALGMLANQ